jgi:PPOX class probable F420-dependent enzyme
METQASARPPEAYLDLLERPLFAHFATVAGDGSPRVNPMWFVWDNAAGVLKLTHTNERYNYRNLQRNPRVAFSITDPDDQYRYLQLRGEVVGFEPDPNGAFYSSLQQRYRGYTSEVRDKDVRVVITIRPTGFKARG